MIVTALLACLPVLLVLVLLLRFGVAVDFAALIALALTAASVWLWCGTDPMVMLRAALSGVIGSLPVVLVMGMSMFQIVVMEEAGAMQRLVAMMKSIAPSEKAVQMLLINVGFGIMLTSLGATTVAILPPIMMALGYSAFVSIVLPSIGYEALCSYALLGVPIVVFAGLTGQSVGGAGLYFALFMPAMSLCITFGMLWLAGGMGLIRKSLLPALITGLVAGAVPLALAWSGMVTLTGVFAGLAVIVALLLYLKLMGKPLTDVSALTDADWSAMRRFSVARAFSPWLVLIGVSLLLNTPVLPFFEWTFKTMAMPVELIPGAPERMRVFWQPWFWVFVSTVVCAPFLKASPALLGRSAKKAFKRGWRPCFAAMMFFALAYLMNHSGKGSDWAVLDESKNMIWALADAAAGVFGSVYPVVAPFLGLMGGFIAGSQTSAMAMFTGLHMSVSEALNASGLLVAAASGVGGGLASVLSPSKVLLAGASIDRTAEVPSAIRSSLAVVLVVTAILGVMTYCLAY